MWESREAWSARQIADQEHPVARVPGSEPAVPTGSVTLAMGRTCHGRRLGRPLVVLSRRTGAEILDDRVLRLAAAAAFWSLLSLPPLALGLLGAVGHLGTLADPHVVTSIRQAVVHGGGAIAEVAGGS